MQRQAPKHPPNQAQTHDRQGATPTVTLTPFALKDAPALIESVFPAQKVPFESQRERKAGAGQATHR